MNFPNLGIGSLLIGTLFSAMVHLGTGGSFYYWFHRREPAPIVAELDLSMSPLSTMPANAGGGRGKASEAWITPKKGNKPPPPVVPEAAQSKEEVAKEEAIAAPCVGEGCDENAPEGTGDGGTGKGEGQYIPASDAFRKPRWIKNFITSADYPLLARQEGKDGRVVLTVLLDDSGHVVDARLLEGSYEALNEVALRKIKDAVFSPAFNDKLVAVSCKVTLPIRFELR